MDRLRNAALLTRLIEGLCSNGDWYGETHVQKTTFFVQELMGVPLGFRFILYKHGPFSFGLRDELTALRADGMLELEPRTYGAQQTVGTRSIFESKEGPPNHSSRWARAC